MKRKKKNCIKLLLSSFITCLRPFQDLVQTQSLTDGSKITKLADDLVRAMFDFVRWLFGTLNSK